MLVTALHLIDPLRKSIRMPCEPRINADNGPMDVQAISAVPGIVGSPQCLAAAPVHLVSSTRISISCHASRSSLLPDVLALDVCRDRSGKKLEESSSMVLCLGLLSLLQARIGWILLLCMQLGSPHDCNTDCRCVDMRRERPLRWRADQTSASVTIADSSLIAWSLPREICLNDTPKPLKQTMKPKQRCCSQRVKGSMV